MVHVHPFPMDDADTERLGARDLCMELISACQDGDTSNVEWLLDSTVKKEAHQMSTLKPISEADMAAATQPESYPTYHAEDLTRGGVQARILLNGQIYSLRITRAGKLILTK